MHVKRQLGQEEFEEICGGRTIWSFWDGNPPDVVLRCFESIKMHNPTRPVVIVSRSTLHKFLDPTDYPLFNGVQGGPEDFSCVQYLSDWVRFTLLDKYGGVWFDASTICTNNVESWVSTINNDSSKLIMFPMHANHKIHGNWAMAALKPGHLVIRAWREELRIVYNETGSGKVPEEYVARAFQEYPQLEGIWNDPSPPPLPYLWVYLAFQVVLQKKPYLKENIHLIPSTDGPMYRRYLCNIERAVTDKVAISQMTADHLATLPLSPTTHDRWFIKLVGFDRQPVQEHLDAKTYAKGSALDMLSRVTPRPVTYGRNLWALEPAAENSTPSTDSSVESATAGTDDFDDSNTYFYQVLERMELSLCGQAVDRPQDIPLAAQ